MVSDAGVVPAPMVTEVPAKTGLFIISKLEALAVIYKFRFNWRTLAAELVKVCLEDSPRLPRISLFLGLTLG